MVCYKGFKRVLKGFIWFYSDYWYHNVDNHGISEDVKNSLSLWYQLRWKKESTTPSMSFGTLKAIQNFRVKK